MAIEGGLITEIGVVEARPGDAVIPCEGGIITAGLVNTHHHLYQWLTRGRAVSCDLFTWLQELYPVWARISVEDVGVAATVGLAELALSGATTVADHHYLVPRGDDSVFDAIAAAGRSVGVRLHLSRGSMDLGQSAGGLPPDDVVEGTDAILASTESVVARLHDGDRVTVVVAPCSPFSVTTELMRESAAACPPARPPVAHPPRRDGGGGTRSAWRALAGVPSRSSRSSGGWAATSGMPMACT